MKDLIEQLRALGVLEISLKLSAGAPAAHVVVPVAASPAEPTPPEDSALRREREETEVLETLLHSSGASIAPFLTKRGA